MVVLEARLAHCSIVWIFHLKSSRLVRYFSNDDLITTLPTSQHTTNMGFKFKKHSLRTRDDKRTAAAELTLRESIYPLCLVTILFFLWVRTLCPPRHT
jgi:hypothetical protein